jgi:hypothetical protein
LGEQESGGEGGRGQKQKQNKIPKTGPNNQLPFFLNNLEFASRSFLYKATIIRHFVSINSQQQQQRRIASCWFVISKSAGDFARGDSASPSAALLGPPPSPLLSSFIDESHLSHIHSRELGIAIYTTKYTPILA